MEIYTLLREFADSWVLLVLTLFFVGVFVWAFRPGSKLSPRGCRAMSCSAMMQNPGAKPQKGGVRDVRQTRKD